MRTAWLSSVEFSMAPIAVMTAALVAALVVPRADAIEYTVDQFSTPVSCGLFSSIDFYGPIGQSFTPTFSSLDVVEVVTDDFDVWNGQGAELAVLIRQGTIYGPVLGTSASTFVPDLFSGITTFLFDTPVVLIPGELHVIQVVRVSGDNWGLAARLAAIYPGGTTIYLGEPVPTKDAWFREGVRVWSSAPPSTWTAIKSMFR